MRRTRAAQSAARLEREGRDSLPPLLVAEIQRAFRMALGGRRRCLFDEEMRRDGAWWLADLGSATGTHLLVEDRGRPVAVGDVYRIAKTEITFLAVPAATQSGS